MSENQKGFAAFLAKKDIVFSAKRYGIDALGAMAQGLFASLLIGTILKTLGQQLGVAILVDIGTFAQAVTGPAMAVSIGYALKCPPLVLFSLIAVGGAANQLGGAGGPLAVFVVTIFAAEFGKLVSKETKVDINVTCVGVRCIQAVFFVRRPHPFGVTSACFCSAAGTLPSFTAASASPPTAFSSAATLTKTPPFSVTCSARRVTRVCRFASTTAALSFSKSSTPSKESRFPHLLHTRHTTPKPREFLPRPSFPRRVVSSPPRCA